MTSRITVRRDHLNGISPRRVCSGWLAIAASHFSGRVSFVPAPVIAVKVALIASPPWP